MGILTNMLFLAKSRQKLAKLEVKAQELKLKNVIMGQDHAKRSKKYEYLLKEKQNMDELAQVLGQKDGIATFLDSDVGKQLASAIIGRISQNPSSIQPQQMMQLVNNLTKDQKKMAVAYLSDSLDVDST